MDDESDGFGLGAEAGSDGLSNASASVQRLMHPVPKILPRPSATIDNSILQNMMIVSDRHRYLRPLPWETGFAALVLGTRPSNVWPYTEAPMRQAVLADEQSRLVAAAKVQISAVTPQPCVSRTAYQRVKFVKQILTEDALKNRAILKWRMLLESDLEATVIGQQMLQLVEALAPESDLEDLLLNVFGCKKTATLVKRVSAMFVYLRWCRRSSIFRPLLCQEPVVYAYTMHLLKSHSAASTASSFNQALTFYRHLLGCHASGSGVRWCETRFRSRTLDLYSSRIMD